MPTVLRIDGLRVVIYPNDHSPAHVHVIGPGWVVVITLARPDVREAIGCNEANARRALDLVTYHQAALIEAWRRYHG